MTYTQMKMLIEFIKIVAGIVSGHGSAMGYTQDHADELERRLLLSCGYERKF